MAQLGEEAEPYLHGIANNEAPAYLRELVQQTREMASRYNLRSSVNSTYIKSRTRTKFAERAFSVAGPLAWNALPTELRMIKDTFKRHLKTHYFKVAFLD